MRKKWRFAPIPVERALSKVDTSAECWTWTAARNVKGYGVFKADDRMHLAHRWLYEALIGPVPEGLDLDHLCRNRACVRPTHLEPVTHAENLLRGETVNARNAAKTHCKRGHEFTPINTGFRGGSRYCRTCSRDMRLARKAAAN
ncbi:HNH endonuclease signature motif containing protein [Streptomyces venezuelae]|uniref:HNH endonuclease signature motif containing protein n=1 Tax=Streptomyces venezuelae TaxID=54571 RepID=UPI003413AFCA